MKYYFIIDLLFFLAIVFFSYFNYIKRTYIKVFDYIKIFLFIFLSSSFSYETYTFLSKVNILRADTYYIAILLAFFINLLILIYSFKYILKALNYLISSARIKILLAKIISFLEAILVISFVLFILMQIYPIKKLSTQTMNKTYSYPYIKKFYIKVIDKNLTSIFLRSDSKINRQESILKSIKSSL